MYRTKQNPPRWSHLNHTHIIIIIIMLNLISMRFDGINNSYTAGDTIRGTLYINPVRDVNLDSITIAVRCEDLFTISSFQGGCAYQKRAHKKECVYEKNMQARYNDVTAIAAGSRASLSFTISLPETYDDDHAVYLSATTQILVDRNVKSKITENVEVKMV